MLTFLTTVLDMRGNYFHVCVSVLIMHSSLSNDDYFKLNWLRARGHGKLFIFFLDTFRLIETNRRWRWTVKFLLLMHLMRNNANILILYFSYVLVTWWIAR